MKLAARAMAEFLQAPERKACGMLLYGPDAGLARERMRQACAGVLGKSDDAFAAMDLPAVRVAADPALLSDELAAFSLLGDKRIVILRDATDALAHVVEAAVAGVPGNFLIVLAGELSPRSSLRLLFETHPRLAALPCYHDESADLSSVIRATLDAARMRLQPGVLEYLVQMLGNDRGITRSELEKIVLFAGDGGELTLEDAALLVGHNKEAMLEELALAVAARTPGAVDHHHILLAREGEQPVALLRAVSRHFQRLYAVRVEVDSGMPLASAVAALKPPVFFRQVPQVTAAAESWSRPRIARALALLARAEADCKSGRVPPALVCAATLLRLSAA